MTRTKRDPVDPDDPTRFQRWPIEIKVQCAYIHMNDLNQRLEFINPNTNCQKCSELHSVEALTTSTPDGLDQVIMYEP